MLSVSTLTTVLHLTALSTNEKPPESPSRGYMSTSATVWQHSISILDKVLLHLTESN